MHKRNIDWVLLIVIILVSLIGLIMVYSASNIVALKEYNDSFYYIKRQSIFLLLGYIIMYLIIKMDIMVLKKYAVGIFIVCLALLLLVLIPGIGSVRGGARSWIGFGSFSIQPSEFMKFGLIILISKYLGDNYNDIKEFKNFIFIFCLIGIIFLLIMLQPDFGTGIVIIISCSLILFVSGAQIKHFLLICSIGIIMFTVLILSAPYRFERITAFIDPWSDPLGSGFQGIQSLFAITPGGLFGHGFNMSMQKHFFLPEPQNDFIFAIFIEEFGLIGGIILLGLFFIIFYRGLIISKTVEDNFLKFLSLGITISLFTQVFINIGVVIGLLPVTGITLPLMSYGGSSLVLTLIMLGILLSISKYQSYEYR